MSPNYGPVGMIFAARPCASRDPDSCCCQPGEGLPPQERIARPQAEGFWEPMRADIRRPSHRPALPEFADCEQRMGVRRWANTKQNGPLRFGAGFVIAE